MSQKLGSEYSACLLIGKIKKNDVDSFYWNKYINTSVI